MPKPRPQPSLFADPQDDLSPEALRDGVVAATDADRGALARQIEAADAVALAVADGGRGLAFATAGLAPVYVPFAEGQSFEDSPLRTALAKAKLLIAHDAKPELHVLLAHGLSFECPLFDTEIAAHLGHMPDLGLEALMLALAPGLEPVPSHSAARRALDRVTALRAMHQPLIERMRAESQLRLFHDHEMPLLWTLFDMEWTGVTIDVPYLGNLSNELGARMREIERQVFAIAKRPFNIGSPQQLGQVLFEDLQLPTQDLHRTWRNKTVSTSAWSLEALKDKHPIVPLILEHRELAKLKGTYADALPAMLSPRDGKLHTTFRQVNTVTGRLSSTNPNLQNVPITSETGRRVRKAFTGSEGGVIISADYTQAELRILAHLADDPGLIAACRSGSDMHKATAAQIYGVPLDQVTPEQRGHAKRINFGMAYGMGAASLAKDTGMTAAEAEQFFATYWRTYPKLQRWMADTKRFARSRGYVETLFGRRRYLGAFQSGAAPDKERSARADRAAINTPAQGSAAEVVSVAMIKLRQRLSREGFLAKMTLQVHDEIVVDSPREEAEAVAAVVREVMETAVDLRAPMGVSVGIGTNWDEA